VGRVVLNVAPAAAVGLLAALRGRDEKGQQATQSSQPASA
jgi:hypothetical protein